MKSLTSFLIISFCTISIIAGSWVFLVPTQIYFELYDRKNEKVILSVPVKYGDTLCLEIEHSFEHIPWFEYYTILEDASFNLDAIAIAGYGAGVPAEMDVETRIENGMVWMEGINSVFDTFKWITSSTYMKTLTLNNEVIFDFRNLPDASFIKGHITIKKGVSFFV